MVLMIVDDWIDGQFLRKGTAVLINVWGVHHVETHFKNPEIFDPDHYLGVTKLAPELAASADYDSRDHYGYGSGRRMCPGMHLAERNLFLGIANLLWGLDIRAYGKVDVDPITGYSEGFLLCAKDFKRKVEVRTQGKRDTILREFELAEKNCLNKH
jgi:hypothetical protein